MADTRTKPTMMSSHIGDKMMSGIFAITFFILEIFISVFNCFCLSRVKREKNIKESSKKKSINYNKFIFFFYWLDIAYVLGISLFFKLSSATDNWFSSETFSVILLIIPILIELFVMYLIIMNILTIEHVIRKSRKKLRKNDMFFEVIIISTLILIIIVTIIGWFCNITINKPLIDVLQLVLGSIVLGVMIDELKNGYKTNRKTKFIYICSLVVILGAYFYLDNEKESYSTSDIIEQTNKLIDQNTVSKKDLKKLDRKVSDLLKEKAK